MTSFTLPLKRVVELTDNHIGLEYYPIFDTDYRAILNAKIVEHYYNREIGQETIDMWRLAMRRKMNEIMPYYNQLYASEKLAIDPLSTINIKTLGDVDTVSESTSNGESTSSNESNSGSRSVASETPQMLLAGNKDYATAASDATSTSNGTATGEQTGTENTTAEQKSETTVSGYQGPASELLMRYRATFLNIDLAIINDLSDLFMLVWDTSDNFTNQGGFFR